MEQLITNEILSFYYKTILPFINLIVDINECSLAIDNCDSDAYCTNTNGSFNCTCHKGYSGNGTLCESKS